MDKFLKPKSALADKKIIVEKKEVSKVSADQANAMMDNLLGELDEEDDDNLQTINKTQKVVYQDAVADEDDEMAFNKNDQLNMKYGVQVGQIHKPTESKKRGYE